MAKIKVRVSYEFAEGLRTVLHCPKPADVKHVPYTCKPRTTKVSFKYEFAEGLTTTFKHPHEIVLKHYVFEPTTSAMSEAKSA